MQVRVITLRYSEGLQGFPEDALREAVAGREEEFQRGEISAEQLQNCVRALSGPRKFLGYGERVRSSLDV